MTSLKNTTSSAKTKSPGRKGAGGASTKSAAKSSPKAAGKGPAKSVKSEARPAPKATTKNASRTKAPSRRGAGARSRQQTKKIMRSRPFLWALITVLLLGAGALYWASGLSQPELGREAELAASNQKQAQSKKQDQLKKQGQVKSQGPKNGEPKVPLPEVRPLPATDSSETAGKTVAAQKAPTTTADPKSNLALGKKPEATPSPKGKPQIIINPAPLAPEELPYETSLGSPVEEASKQVDALILQELAAQGVPAANIKILSMEKRASPEDAYYFQKLEIDLPEKSVYEQFPSTFRQNMEERLAELGSKADLAKVSPQHYVLSINGLVTHEIFLRFFGTAAMGQSIPLPAGEARVAIVIDDMGASLSALRALLELDYPVSIAIWPRAAQAKESAQMAHARNLEVLLHQPMQPLEYPRVKPGPGAVLNSMSPEEISRIVRQNLALLPYVSGLNNHMGSSFTQNRGGLEAVLSALPRRNMFVLDSVTHGGSKFYTLAKERNFPAQRRDVFLDVIRDKNAILHQLNKAANLARRQGYAIAIGHPAPETLAALAEWQKTRDKSVKIVRVQDLLKFKRNN